MVSNFDLPLSVWPMKVLETLCLSSTRPRCQLPAACRIAIFIVANSLGVTEALLRHYPLGDGPNRGRCLFAIDGFRLAAWRLIRRATFTALLLSLASEVRLGVGGITLCAADRFASTVDSLRDTASRPACSFCSRPVNIWMRDWSSEMVRSRSWLRA